MAVRNSLMNAGNPIANAFAMEQLRPAERATYAATASLLWSLGWTIAGPWYSILQATLGFEAGYAVNFVTVIVLYSVGHVAVLALVPRDRGKTRAGPGARAGLTRGEGGEPGGGTGRSGPAASLG